MKQIILKHNDEFHIRLKRYLAREGMTFKEFYAQCLEIALDIPSKDSAEVRGILANLRLPPEGNKQ